jgi:hypothetical protein
MTVPIRCLQWVGCAVLVLALVSPAAAQLEGQLSAYTGANAEGYLQPLADAIGTDLNGGLYSSARIPNSGLHISLETRVIAVLFSEDDETFEAVTEGDFSPEQTATASTVVGPGEATFVDGDEETSFAFPGGFSLNSFAIAVPQVRIGAVRGTEALIRYFAIDTGDVEIGDISLYGFGLRHSISQYMGPAPPVDVAAGFFWQSFKLGDDLIDATAFTVGVQASKRFGTGAVSAEPYAGVSVDMFSMDVAYDSDALGEIEPIDLSFESDTSFRLTAGLSLRLAFLTANGEYCIANQNSFAFGVGFGF